MRPRLAAGHMRRGSSSGAGLARRGSKSAGAPGASTDEMVLTTLSIELPLPLGIGLTDKNTISELQPTASPLWQEGDRLVWADGKEVRGGGAGRSVGEAIDKTKQLHEFVIQRWVQNPIQTATFIVRLVGAPGLGIGLTELNHVTDLTPGQPAALDGRLQVRRQLLGAEQQETLLRNLARYRSTSNPHAPHRSPPPLSESPAHQSLCAAPLDPLRPGGRRAAHLGRC